MRRTSIPALLGVALAGGVTAWLVQVGLAAGGAPSFVPPLSLALVLFAVSGVLLLLGRPVRRMVRGISHKRVDPFFAMRVLVLAKASSITGALLGGGAAALVLYAASRPGLPLTPGFWPGVLSLAGSIALVAAGLAVESWCRIPPADPAEPAAREAERL